MTSEYLEYVKGLNTRKTWELYERAKKIIPGGASSHGQCYPVFDPYPLAFVRGEGTKVWDIDGNEYLDFIMAMGPLILGHCHPVVMDAAREQLNFGTMFALLHEKEVLLAEKIHEMVPNAEMIRYCNSGGEATQNAIRFARGYTKKDKIIKFEGHYHGTYDYVLTGGMGFPALGPPDSPYTIPVSWGVPADSLKNTILLPWNDIATVKRKIKRDGNKIAAVITEPIMMNIGTVMPEDNYLHELQELCQSNDIVFILDEVISGFRFAPGGAQEYFDLDPDIATFAKALGAGFPIAAVTGKREIMQYVVPGKIAHSGTYFANPLCVAAAYASLSFLSKDDGAIYKHLNKIGTSLKNALEDAVKATNTEAIVQGEGAMGTQLYFTKLKKITNYRDFLNCDTTKYLRFHRELLKRGIYFHSQQAEHLFVCTEHSEWDIDRLKQQATDALRNM